MNGMPRVHKSEIRRDRWNVIGFALLGVLPVVGFIDFMLGVFALWSWNQPGTLLATKGIACIAAVVMAFTAIVGLAAIEDYKVVK